MASNSDIFRRAHQMARRYPAPMTYRQAFSLALRLVYAAERKRRLAYDELTPYVAADVISKIRALRAARTAALPFPAARRSSGLYLGDARHAAAAASGLVA